MGAGLDLKTTGTGGKQWEILATGKASSQGVGKFNIRDVTTSTDVLTVDATDHVTVRNLSANNQTVNGTLTATSSGLTISATTSSASNAAVGGTGNGYGVVGLGLSASGTGVAGYELSSVGYGVSGSSPYVGVYGAGHGNSAEGAGTGSAGVWGDTAGPGNFAGILGTADAAIAGVFLNDGPVYPTIFAQDDAANGNEVFEAFMAGLMPMRPLEIRDAILALWTQPRRCRDTATRLRVHPISVARPAGTK